jgi:hypothetical protein
VGYLHQYHLVTVRKDQVAMAAFPVGEAIDVREITGDFQAEAVRLARLPPTVQGGIRLTGRLRQQVAGGQWTVGVENPTSHLVDYTVVAESPDSRWRAEPDHAHGTLKPGQRHEIRFQAAYPSGPADESFDPIRIVLSREILTKTTRYAIPEVTATVPFMPATEPPSAAQPNGVLVLDGDGDCVGIAAEKVPLPQGPFTLECWLRAKQFGKRVGLLAKTESSEYGIFVSGLANGIMLRWSTMRQRLSSTLMGSQWGERKARLVVSGRSTGCRCLSVPIRMVQERQTRSLPVRSTRFASLAQPSIRVHSHPSGGSTRLTTPSSFSIAISKLAHS